MVRKKATAAEVAEDQTAELPNMPAASPIGIAARAVIKLGDKITAFNEKADEELAAAKKKVLDLLKEEGKEAVLVDGITFRAVHVSEKDDLRVYRKKKSKIKDEDDEQ